MARFQYTGCAGEGQKPPPLKIATTSADIMDMEISSHPDPEEVAALVHALRSAAEKTNDEEDAVLRQLGAALCRVAEHLEWHRFAGAGAAGAPEVSPISEATLHEQLLVLSERAQRLRLVLSAEACLVHADPPRARAASHLLLRLPPLENLAGEQATLVGQTPVSAGTAMSTLSATREMLAAAAPERATLEQLGLLPLIEEIDRSLKQLTVAASRLLAQPAGGAVPAAGLGVLFAEAAERCAEFRAYVQVATGHLSRQGDDPLRRQRLLAPLSRLAGVSPFFVAR